MSTKLKISSVKNIIRIAGHCPLCDCYVVFQLDDNTFEDGDCEECSHCGQEVMISLDDYQ
jgi:hypothetical protein